MVKEVLGESMGVTKGVKIILQKRKAPGHGCHKQAAGAGVRLSRANGAAAAAGRMEAASRPQLSPLCSQHVYYL